MRWRLGRAGRDKGFNGMGIGSEGKAGAASPRTVSDRGRLSGDSSRLLLLVGPTMDRLPT